jgi:hypothetical protein
MAKAKSTVKAKKRRPPKSKPREVKPSISISEREQLLRDIEAECREQLAIVETRRQELTLGSFDPQLTSATNTLAKSIAILSAEGRQQDKHKVKAIEDITPEAEDAIVCDFLGDITPARRKKIAAHLAELDSAGQLLGHGS